MKLLFDFFPILLFFVTFKLYGIYAATAVAIGASFAQIGLLLFKGRKIDRMLWVSLWVILPVVTFFNFARFEPSAEVGAGLLFSWQRWASGGWGASAATHAVANILAVIR